jgi:hypothetical protein
MKVNITVVATKTFTAGLVPSDEEDIAQDECRNSMERKIRR